MALLTIDTQCDTLDGQPMEIPGTTRALPHMQRLIRLFRKQAMPIIHIVRIYRADGSNADLCRREAVACGASLMIENSDGCQLAPDLLPDETTRLDCSLLLNGGIQEVAPMEVVIYKPRWGAFYQTPLEDHLKKHRINTLVFIGCNFPNCPRTSIYEASERDFRVILVTDALSGLYPRGEAEMENIGVNLMTAEDLARELTARFE